MTTFLLIRHALCDPVGRSIAGRTPGIHLNETGKRQVERLAQRLQSVTLAAIYSSPLERALETAGPIANSTGLRVETAEAWNEMDFGEWTGRSLADLDQLPHWRRFNALRSSTTVPAGENAGEVLGRVLRDVERLRVLHPGPRARVVVVSHGDVLRTLVAHSLGMSLDLFQRIEISPASISLLEITEEGPRILLLNSTDGVPGGFDPPA